MKKFYCAYFARAGDVITFRNFLKEKYNLVYFCCRTKEIVGFLNGRAIKASPLPPPELNGSRIFKNLKIAENGF